jgi:predicted thioesterase
MKKLFKIGDEKFYSKVITSTDFAAFHGEVVHAVCGTFSMARDMEWTTRQFVLDMREHDEEGVGTFVHVNHEAPVFEGEKINYKGVIEQLNGFEVICSIEAYVDQRLVATGKTGQKILKRETIKKLFSKE